MVREKHLRHAVELMREFSTEGCRFTYSQASCGFFSCRLKTLRLPKITLVHTHWDRSLLVSGCSIKNHVSFFLAVDNQPTGRFMGAEMAADAMSVLRCNDEVDLRSTEKCELIHVFVARQALDEALQTLHGVDLDRCFRRSRTIFAPMGYAAQICNLFKKVFCQYDDHTSCGEELAQKLINQLCHCFADSDLATRDSLSRRHHCDCMKAARHFIETRLDCPFDLADLCKALSVCERTVEYIFHDIYRMTPQQYCRCRRLNAVHRQLLGGEGTAQMVTGVALDHGFSHLGRFSQDYRSLFGQSPSETLRAAIRRRIPEMGDQA